MQVKDENIIDNVINIQHKLPLTKRWRGFIIKLLHGDVIGFDSNLEV